MSRLGVDVRYGGGGGGEGGVHELEGAPGGCSKPKLKPAVSLNEPCVQIQSA
jgi:hypothetical protein